VDSVGVFVNADSAEVAALIAEIKLSVAQLHGDESPEAVAQLARAVKVIKAFRAGADFPLATLDDYPAASAFLLDAAETGQYGGTGRTADWPQAQAAAATHRIILAGGLQVENVADAIRFVKPYGVDVASGTEHMPGRKDHGKLREFIQEVRRAESQLDAAAAKTA
jgi:phosphoribosylanthranilate isomerase